MKRRYPLLVALLLLLLLLVATDSTAAPAAPDDCPIGNICLTPGHGDIAYCEGGVMDVELVDGQTAVFFCRHANYQVVVPVQER